MQQEPTILTRLTIPIISTILIALCLMLIVSSAHALQSSSDPIKNPIYLADSPTASDAIIRLNELITQSNLDEASRLADQVITDLGDRLIESTYRDIYIPVRIRLQLYVLDHPMLLKAYRTRKSPSANAWLESGDWQRVARQAWLTEPGLIASLHLAQTLIESAHFHAGFRVLEELTTHPDAQLHAKEIATLANLVASLIDTDEIWTSAAQWSRLAKQSPAKHTPLVRSTSRRQPRPISSIVWNTQSDSSPISLIGIVPGALGIAELTPRTELDHVQSADQTRRSGANWDPTPWAAPVVVGNLLYINDGITISCFDRFTLRPIWRLQTQNDPSVDLPVTIDARARLGRLIEDATTITIDGHGSGDDLYVPAGIPRGGGRIGDERLFKLDAKTGQTRWSVNLHELDDSLADASIRGQVVLDEGVVVVGARTNNRKQRLINFALVGLDSVTGQLLWIRQIASAGSLPFQQTGQLAHSPMLSDGIIYWTDHIGLGFAIESATGRVLWARSLPPPDLYARLNRPSFSSNTPVINQYGFFTLSTDGTKILQLDKHTGQTLATRPAQPLGESLYLLDLGDQIACVSKFQIAYYRAAQFATSVNTRSPLLGGTQGIRGRIIVANNQLFVPLNSGVEVLDPAQPQRSKHIKLDATGNIIVLDGQIIVVDEMQVSSFLAWDTASKLLAERIESNPASAITLVELAYRAARADQILPATQRAMGVIASLPITGRDALMTQLFDALLDMVEPAHRSSLVETVLDSTIQLQLLDHLGTLAQTHQQVVAHRMALGHWHTQFGESSKAIGAYQDILDEPALRAAMWEGAGIAVRGGLEATRRIGTVLNATGYIPYRPFDQLARVEQRFLESSTDPKLWEQLARRYPWSIITPKLWLEASQRWADAHQNPASINASINAAVQGLDSAKMLDAIAQVPDQTIIDQLAERAITGMIETNRAHDAQALASSLIQKFPNLTLRIAGKLITSDQIALKAKLATQLPVLGDAFIDDDHPLLITGSPIKPTTRIDQGGIVLYAPQFGRIEYVRAGRGAFESVWTLKSRSNETPIIPWQDQMRTLVLWPEGSDSPDTGTLQAIETTTGSVIWSIENIRSKLAQMSPRVPDNLARVDGQFQTPARGPAPINQLVLVTDGHTLIISDRIGRAMGIDVFSGDRLWQRDLPTNRLYDMDINSSILGICGVHFTDQATQQQRGSTTSIVASIDPRTGELITLIDRFGNLPRWVRVGTNTSLYVATTEHIVAINTDKGTIDWVLNDDRLADSISSWIWNDQLVVLDDNSQMWTLSLAQGTRSERPMELRQHIIPRSWVDVRSSIGTLAIAGTNGLVVFNEHAQLIAADPLNIQSPMIDLARGMDRIVFLERPQIKAERWVAKLDLLDVRDARLLDTTELSVPFALGRTPRSITAITGGVIVGYNEVSIFVRTTAAIQ